MNQIKGIALLSDLQGNILETLRDSLGLAETIQTGMPFPRLATPGGLAKALSFILEINTKGTALDYEINIDIEGHPRRLYFTGRKFSEELLIVGAENHTFARDLFAEMMFLRYGQTRSIETGFMEDKCDEDYFDEISRLNNELISMQRELAKKNAELEHLNQEKNRFLGMAAHDLRNPLHASLSSSEHLLEENPIFSGSQSREILETIHTSLEFMTRLVDDLLDVSKIESGHLQLEYQASDLISLVTKNVRLNRVLAAKKQIEISLNCDPFTTVVVDNSKIEQVLNNLIGNAVKFSLPGSQIEVRLINNGEHFCLSVKDWGPGISEVEISNLFRPFQRGQAIGTAGEKNTGLGLMIVKNIVEGHGGQIWIESQAGLGTTFFVTIPTQPIWFRPEIEESK